MMNKCVIGAAAAVATLTTGALADDVLLIDLSVANEITISATSAASDVSATFSNFTGFYLENFYGAAGNSLTATLVSGDLSTAANASDGSASLFRGGAGSNVGLNVWSFSTDTNVSVTAGSQAFSGSATWSVDAAMYADMLAGMASGDVYAGADTDDDLPAGGVIGQYRVIPAPGALSLMGLGLAGAMRRRR